MLVTSKELFKTAQSKGFAIPAPDFMDSESLQAYVEVAEELGLPLILAFAESHLPYMSLEEAALNGKHFAEKASVPVVLHLDHGETIDVIKKAVDLGFSSVMIDASSDSYEENVRKTKEVVEYAHKHDVVVEAEIGHVGAGENYETETLSDSVFTEVEEAVQFVKDTQVDSLAISIGTAHGHYTGEPNINFERLDEIRAVLDIPLVLHGGSSSGDENLKKCSQNGMTKINIFTDIVNGAINEINKEKPTNYLKLKELAKAGMKDVLRHYYDVFETNKYLE